MAAKGGVPICPTTGRGCFAGGGGNAFSSRRGREVGIGHIVCGKGVGQLYSRWPGCPTCCWLAGRSIDDTHRLAASLLGVGAFVLLIVGVKWVCGCVVFWGL